MATISLRRSLRVVCALSVLIAVCVRLDRFAPEVEWMSLTMFSVLELVAIATWAALWIKTGTASLVVLTLAIAVGGLEVANSLLQFSVDAAGACTQPTRESIAYGISAAVVPPLLLLTLAICALLAAGRLPRCSKRSEWLLIAASCS